MARKPAIPQEVKDEIASRVERFNDENRPPQPEPHPLEQILRERGFSLPGAESAEDLGDYVPRFRGKYLYLDRIGPGGQFQVCRLEWTGDMEAWEFAIYKHSSNRYAPDEWWFPGAGEIDGTVEGAMRAGVAAYPL